MEYQGRSFICFMTMNHMPAPMPRTASFQVPLPEQGPFVLLVERNSRIYTSVNKHPMQIHIKWRKLVDPSQVTIRDDLLQRSLRRMSPVRRERLITPIFSPPFDFNEVVASLPHHRLVISL